MTSEKLRISGMSVAFITLAICFLPCLVALGIELVIEGKKSEKEKREKRKKPDPLGSTTTLLVVDGLKKYADLTL